MSALRAHKKSLARIESNPPPEQNSQVSAYTATIQGAIQKILQIIRSPKNRTLIELDDELEKISHFFRNEKFSTCILPTLEALANLDQELWKQARYTPALDHLPAHLPIGTPLTPKTFEQLPKSTCPVFDTDGTEIAPMVKDREVVLLSIYGASYEDIGHAYFRLTHHHE